ncbi:general secretory pathway protein E [Candidatus Magnetoovum chiemensis]|nr:general secretory pathway protein E [Candidatus Magnetoovum chiemensis]
MLLGEILAQHFSVKTSDIERALELQLELGGYIGQILLNMGLITEPQLIKALSIQLNIPVFEKKDTDIVSLETLNSLNEKIDVTYLLKKNFLPLSINNSTVTVLTTDPLDSTAGDYLTKTLGCKIVPLLATEQTINELAKPFRYLKQDAVSLYVEGSPEMLKEMAAEAPVIKFLNNLLSNAVELRATDIHLEPSEEKGNRLRYRIDGVLHEVETLAEKLYLAVISRIKLLAGLDIAEKRLPQDGKFSTRIASTLIDIRVSSIPFAIGEGIVMRLLFRERLSFDITNLGIEKDMLPMIMEMINLPYGIMLVTGPTGSGKTTTLYSVLTSLDRKEKKVITVEDPVEYKLDGINQIQVKSEIGLDFASSLRSILRHDPDVILVGEIRDPETAKMAVQSALTGHLVLSTLHTNDAASSLFRLIEMGIEEYLLNATIVGVIAQRIVRRNCQYCSKELKLEDDIIKKHRLKYLYDSYKNELSLQWSPQKGAGCKHCANTGYRGMIAIYEMFQYKEDVKDVFRRSQSIDSLRNFLTEKHSFRDMRSDGMLKVVKGITSIEEVLRVS